MKKLIFIGIIFILTSCNGENKEKIKQLKGEWIITQTLSDSEIILTQRKDSIPTNIFPVENYLIFNDDNSISINTIGEFGCGQGEMENL
ncbi:hypothetical protein NTJ12_002464, partial [Flavobacterium psychrophilum]|nr:hypothetical protein [Flavobacterium psychrophilum]